MHPDYSLPCYISTSTPASTSFFFCSFYSPVFFSLSYFAHPFLISLFLLFFLSSFLFLLMFVLFHILTLFPAYSFFFSFILVYLSTPLLLSLLIPPTSLFLFNKSYIKCFFFVERWRRFGNHRNSWTDRLEYEKFLINAVDLTFYQN